MAFETGILDAFPDTEGPPMTGWATPSLAAGLKSASGVCLANAANALGVWNSVLAHADCEARVIISTAAASGGIAYVFARLKDIASAATLDGYSLSITEAATDTWAINVVTNGVASAIGATFNQEVANGDAVGIRCIGTSISAWYKPSGGSWTQLATRTDSTYAAAGYIGLGLTDTTGRLDDFGGGVVIQTITDAKLTDADTFGADALKLSIVDAKLTDADTFGADAVKLSIADVRLVDGDLFGADVLRLSIADARLTDADTFGVDALKLSIVDAKLTDADSFGADALKLSISDARLVDGDTFGADALTLSIGDAIYSDPDIFGADTLIQGGGAQTITDAAYSDPDSFGSDTLTLSISDARLIDPDLFGVDHLGLTIADARLIDAYSFGADRIWTTLPTPTERVWPVEYEARVLAVVVGNRTLPIAGESRIVTVAHEDRALPIAHESRIVVVSD